MFFVLNSTIIVSTSILRSMDELDRNIIVTSSFEVLATLTGVNTEDITSADFVTV